MVDFLTLLAELGRIILCCLSLLLLAGAFYCIYRIFRLGIVMPDLMTPVVTATSIVIIFAAIGAYLGRWIDSTLAMSGLFSGLFALIGGAIGVIIFSKVWPR